VIDAMGDPQDVLVVGGTSQIAQAVLARWLDAGRLRRVVLAARPSPLRDERMAWLRDAGVAHVSGVDLDVDDVDGCVGLVESAFDAGVDVVLFAVGMLGSQERALTDEQHAVDIARATYLVGVPVLIASSRRLRAQGHGALVVLSSVAGVRARPGNFVYGSAKAGLDALASGLADELHGSGAHVSVVRPGFVRTRMTEGLAEAPFTVDADTVAEAVTEAVRRQRVDVWVPAPVRAVAGVLRSAPRAVIRRLPG
jgi:decaprenylphospho-beta-D-erythro-pentofuranosid-2-ulose 2-reductase